jgi:hypothetical protein
MTRYENQRYIAYVKDFSWGTKCLVYDLWSSPVEQREEAIAVAQQDFRNGFRDIPEAAEGYREVVLDNYLGPASYDYRNTTVFHWNTLTHTWG